MEIPVVEKVTGAKPKLTFSVNFVIQLETWKEWLKVFTEPEIKDQIAHLGVEAFSLYVKKIQTQAEKEKKHVNRIS